MSAQGIELVDPEDNISLLTGEEFVATAGPLSIQPTSQILDCAMEALGWTIVHDKVLIKNPVVLAVIVFLVLSVLIICDGVINYQTYSIGKFIVRSVFLVFFILISILFLKGGVRYFY